MRRSPLPFSPNTGRGWGAERKSERSSSRTTSLAGPYRLPGTEVAFEQEDLVDPVDAVDLLQKLGYGSGVQVAVPRPSIPVRPTVERVHPLVEELESVRADSCQRIVAGRRQGMQVGGHRHALVVGSRDLNGYPKEASRLEVLGDVVDEAISEGEIVDGLALWYSPDLGDYEEADRSSGRARPRQRARATSADASVAKRSKS